MVAFFVRLVTKADWLLPVRWGKSTLQDGVEGTSELASALETKTDSSKVLSEIDGIWEDEPPKDGNAKEGKNEDRRLLAGLPLPGAQVSRRFARCLKAGSGASLLLTPPSDLMNMF